MVKGLGMADGSLSQAVEEAARRLVSFSHGNDGSVVSTSALYPSGAPVRVRAAFDGATCFVNDMGFASHEADLAGATHRQFVNQAKIVSEQSGVSFDNHSFFAIQVPIDRLLGAVKVVAAASQRAAILTEAHISEQAKRNDKEILVQKLVSVFGRAKVDEEVDIVGASGHTWQIAGVVRDSRVIAFDCATPAAPSIYSTHAKFADIRRLEDNTGGVITVPQMQAFKSDYLSLLRQVANDVIEIDAPNASYEKIAA